MSHKMLIALFGTFNMMAIEAIQNYLFAKSACLPQKFEIITKSRCNWTTAENFSLLRSKAKPLIMKVAGLLLFYINLVGISSHKTWDYRKLPCHVYHFDICLRDITPTYVGVCLLCLFLRPRRGHHIVMIIDVIRDITLWESVLLLSNL